MYPSFMPRRAVRAVRAGAAVSPALFALACAAASARPAFAADWGEWQAVPDQVQAAVDIRLQRDFNTDRDPEVHFQFRNRYGQKITIGYVVQGEDSTHTARQIDGAVTLDPGDQRLSREQLRLQTAPFATLTGIAFSKITFSGTPPKPTSAGARWESAETRKLERDLSTADADVAAAEAARFDAEDFLVRVQRSAERGSELLLGEGHNVNAVMGSDDVAKAQLRLQSAKQAEDTARQSAERVKAELESARKADESATANRKDLATRLAPTREWAASGDWPRVEAALHAALTDRAAIIADPDRAILELNLGIAQMHQNHTADALVAFTTACRLAPLNGACRCELAAALIASDRLDEAGDALTEAIRLSPNDASYRYNLGVLREQQGRREQAKAAYQQATELEPNNPTYRDHLKSVTGGTPQPTP